MSNISVYCCKAALAALASPPAIKTLRNDPVNSCVPELEAVSSDFCLKTPLFSVCCQRRAASFSSDVKVDSKLARSVSDKSLSLATMW
uniref:Uncharacterized protein n=1 Tax=Romanomermis culicivorax TaxID=13658 RepID=A0A915JP74_ROMCU